MLDKLSQYRKIILILCLLLIILVIALPFLFPTPPKTPPSVINTSPSPYSPPAIEFKPSTTGPTLSNQPQKSPTTELVEKKSTFAKTLPNPQKNFGVIYIKATDSFIITIFQAPVEENMKKAVEWLKGQGFTDDDLERLKIKFSYPRELMDSPIPER